MIKFVVKYVLIMNAIELKTDLHHMIDKINDVQILNAVKVLLTRQSKQTEALCKEEVLKTKLISRAEKSENDINAGKVFSRAEIEQRTK